MKKLIAIATAFALLVAPSVASAGKKKPKPYKSETVSILANHPVFNTNSGSVVAVTAQEFMARCALPATNGLDGYVFEIPKEYQAIQTYISATGSTSAPAYDIDIYTFDSSCKLTLAINSAGTDQTGVLPVGTAYIFMHSYEPGDLEAQFTLKPY